MILFFRYVNQFDGNKIETIIDKIHLGLHGFQLLIMHTFIFKGFNATVFAYGATGSGKTYTMVGQPNNPGCMARALNDLFATMDDENNRNENMFKVLIFLFKLQRVF